MENLNVIGMLKNHKLSQSISDVSWSMFINMIKYKSEWLCNNLIQIGRYEASSKTCNVCGYKKNDLKLNDRVWLCSDCNTTHDRDINAAININNFALKTNMRMESPLKNVECIPVDDRLLCKPKKHIHNETLKIL